MGKQDKVLAAEPLDKWLDKTRRLLAQEQREEVQLMQEELRALNDGENPNVLTNLRLASFSTALFGRTLLKLALPSAHLQRPKPHQFTVGDLVQIRAKGKPSTQKQTKGGSGESKLPTGIVARVEEHVISIAVGSDEDMEEEDLLSMGSGIVIDRLANNATFLKISSALDQLAKFDYGEAQSVVDM